MKHWTDFLLPAALIVAKKRLEWPHCEGVMCGGGGGSSGAYSRKGTGTQIQTYGVPTAINDLITTNAASATTDPGLASKQTTLFGNLMDETPQSQPGYSALTGFSELSPSDYTGKQTLEEVSRRNPYDGGFEVATEDAFRQRASDAMAQVASGPDAVRGGDARTGIAQGVMATRLAQERGQEVRQAQLQDLIGVLDASKSAASIENNRANTATQASLGLSQLSSGVAERGLGAARAVDANRLNNLGLLQLAATLQGAKKDTRSDDFSGKGAQEGWQSGVSCCFIFLEALNGRLPWYIELARYDYVTPNRRLGYKWMASWLVPLMRENRTVRKLVNFFVIKPFLLYGAWLYYDDTAKRTSALLAPYCKTWLALWGVLGRIYGR